MKVYVNDVIRFLKQPQTMVENTVDRLESGDPDQEVTGIASVFLATREIIEEVKKRGINLIISHEGIFFSHWDKQSELGSNRVYLQKKQEILKSGIAIYRYHDQIHRDLPDAITAGLLRSLGWDSMETVNRASISIVEIPGMTLLEVLLHIKKKLGISYVRFAGDLSAPCRKIGVLVGYRGSGDSVIAPCEEDDLDLVIYGEGPEWETPEYIRDAAGTGRKRALIVLGHAESEAPGMELVATRLKNAFPSVPVHFIPTKPVFRVF